MTTLETLAYIFKTDPNSSFLRSYLSSAGIRFDEPTLPPEQCPAAAAQLLLDYGLITQQQADPWLAAWAKKQGEMQAFLDDRHREEGRLDLVGLPYPEQVRRQEAEYLADQARRQEEIARLKAQLAAASLDLPSTTKQ